MKARAWLAAVGLSLGVAGCSRPPRPPLVADAEMAIASPQLEQARPLAPQAVAHAERLQRLAEEAADSEHATRAELLAERTIAAVQHAVVLARVARAEARIAAARVELEQQKTEQAELEAQQQKVASQIEQLELRAKVLRDAQPLTPNVKGHPKQEAARKEAASALATQARLLCLATELVLGKTTGELSELRIRLDRLGMRLGMAGSVAPGGQPSTDDTSHPLDEARALRSSCLGQLTLARRPETRDAPESSEADQLLQALSSAGFSPSRDDRGVVVVLRAKQWGSGVPAELREPLGHLARVAKANPRFPVLVVAHARAASTPPEVLTQRARDAKGVLLEQGALKVEAATAGDHVPTAPRQPTRRDRNERLEVVFVAPTL